MLRDFTIVAPTELYPLARVLLRELLGWNWTTLHLHETLHRIRTVRSYRCVRVLCLCVVCECVCM